MEFKYRAIDKKPTTTTTSSFPHSTATYLSESSLPGATGFSCLPTNTFQMPAVNDVLWRQLQKEQIRREIIAAEIARRRELEAEVRRELALERSLGGIQMQRYLGAPQPLQQRVNPTAVGDVVNIIGDSQPRLLPIESPVEIKPPSPQSDRDKVIVLAKPKPDHDLLSAKRKAVAPAVCDTEPSASGLSKKAKEEWKCALCQVGATSEASFNKHLVGKKHKAKEAAARTQMIGLDAKPRQSPQPCLILEELNQAVVDKGVMETKNEKQAQLVEKSHNIGVLENPSETDTEKAGKTNASARKKVWCEVCQIYTLSQVVMETHKKGKKHQKKQMMQLSQN